MNELDLMALPDQRPAAKKKRKAHADRLALAFEGPLKMSHFKPLLKARNSIRGGRVPNPSGGPTTLKQREKKSDEHSIEISLGYDDHGNLQNPIAEILMPSYGVAHQICELWGEVEKLDTDIAERIWDLLGVWQTRMVKAEVVEAAIKGIAKTQE